jgi:phosphotransferase system HPr (HPr) family protein
MTRGTVPCGLSIRCHIPEISRIPRDGARDRFAVIGRVGPETAVRSRNPHADRRSDTVPLASTGLFRPQRNPSGVCGPWMGTLMSDDSVTRREVTVQLLNGLHLRPASMIARLVAKSNCQVRILNGEKNADAGDVFDLIALKAERGTVLTLESVGAGSVELLEAIIPWFEVEDAGEEESDPG